MRVETTAGVYKTQSKYILIDIAIQLLFIVQLTDSTNFTQKLIQIGPLEPNIIKCRKDNPSINHEGYDDGASNKTKEKKKYTV